MPLLARFSPGAFVRGYLETCLATLMHHAASKKSGERGAAFVALGKLALAVGGHITPQLPQIVRLVRDGLAPKASSRAARRAMALQRHGSGPASALCREALRCVSMLAQAVGPSSYKLSHLRLVNRMRIFFSKKMRKKI